MPNHEVNPDSTVLRQLDEQWPKIAALLVWKFAPEGVMIDAKDFEAFRRQSDAGEAVLLTHGMKDGLHLSITDEAGAQRLAQHDATQRGRG